MTTTRIFTDAMGRKVEIPFPPKRIISTVPSTTEFLFELGLGNQVVGRTRFCRYPKDALKKIPNIGGPKDLHTDKIELLNPDLILANEEENDRNQIESLALHYPVFVCKIRTLEDALENIWLTGEITDREKEAQRIIQSVQEEFDRIRPLQPARKAAYLIWKEPYISVSNDTFIHEMMNLCGLENVFANRSERYPRVTVSELQKENPEIVLLASEPYPFGEKHLPEIQKILPNSRIELVDGEMFAWYESHLIRAAGYFRELINKL